MTPQERLEVYESRIKTLETENARLKTQYVEASYVDKFQKLTNREISETELKAIRDLDLYQLEAAIAQLAVEPVPEKPGIYPIGV